MEDKIFVVETVSIFKQTYYVKARDGTHAADDVVCELGNIDYKSGSQKHIDEVISDVYEVTADEFIKVFDKENPYLKIWSKDKKLNRINIVKYED